MASETFSSEWMVVWEEILRVEKANLYLEYISICSSENTAAPSIEEVSNVKHCHQVAGWYPERMMPYQGSAGCWQIGHSVGLEARLDFVNGSPCY